MLVLSLGGSLIVNEHGIDVAYLKRFVTFIKKEVEKGKRFLIVCGGGVTSRQYTRAAQLLVPRAATVDLHYIGVRATQLNAELVRTAFGSLAHPVVLRDDLMGRIKSSKPVIICGGGLPGRSTDYAAVLWASRYGVKKVFNLTNVDGVYSSDPRKDPRAKRFDQLTWKQYQNVLGMKSWGANAHAPFDPIASRFASKHGIAAVILDGTNLKNFQNALHAKPFLGTTLDQG